MVPRRRVLPPAEQLETGLASVERALAKATPARRAELLTRAGDLCASMGETRPSLRWYGQAVDQYLELGESVHAARICRMILYVQPEAVRARCTLAWIDIAAGRYDAAADRIYDYAEHAREAGQEELAAQQLAWMFDAAPEGSALRERIVFALLRLGDGERAEDLSRRHRPAAADAPPATQRTELWTRVLEGALAGA